MVLLIGKLHQFLTELSALDMIMAGFYHFTFYFNHGAVYLGKMKY